MLCSLAAGPRVKLGKLIKAFHLLHALRLMRLHDMLDASIYIEIAAGVFEEMRHGHFVGGVHHARECSANRAGMTGKSSMNSRMETLFRLFDLDSVMIDSGLAPDIDYGKVNRLLEQHRKESRSWLEKAMEN